MPTQKSCHICKEKIGVASKTCKHCGSKQPYKQYLENRKKQVAHDWKNRQKKNRSVHKLYDATNLLLHKWDVLEQHPILLLSKRTPKGVLIECFCPWQTDTDHAQDALVTIKRIYESLLNDVHLLLESQEEVPPEQQEWSSSLDQEDPEPPHIKEEQEELWTSQEGEQLQGLEEADITKFPFTPVPVKSEDDEEKPQSSQLHHSPTEENREAEPLTSSSTQHMETEADGDECGGSEPGSNSDSLLQPVTEDKTSDSPGTDDSEDDWIKPGDFQSGLNPQTDNIYITSERPLTCSKCGKSFCSKSSLNLHERIHTEEKLYTCSVCRRSFHVNEQLKDHMRVHTGHRTYSCPVCGRSCTEIRDLTKHMRVHVEEKPFSCDVCGKSYVEKRSLKKHTRVHTGRSTALKCWQGSAVSSRSHTWNVPPGKTASPAKRDTVVGYLHDVSAVKQSRQNVRYFEATLQTGREKYHRLVVFAVDKRTALAQASQSNCVVKLSNVKRSVSYSSPEGFDVLFSCGSSVEVVEDLPFLPREPRRMGPMTVKEVLGLGPRQHVGVVEAKIQSTGSMSRVVPVDGAECDLEDFQVCNPTGQTTLTLWDKQILAVQASKSCRFGNLETRKFGDRTVLTSTGSTTISEISASVESAEAQDDRQNISMYRGTVSGVQISANHRCQRCHANQEEFVTRSSTHRCQCCKLLQRSSSFAVSYSGVLVLTSEGQDKSLIFTNSAVFTYLKEKDPGGSMRDVEEIEEHFISVDDVDVSVNAEGLVLSIKECADSEQDGPVLGLQDFSEGLEETLFSEDGSGLKD